MPALSSCFVPATLFFVCTLAARSSLSTLISCPEIHIALLSHLVLGLALTHLTSSTLKIFKQTLSNKSLRRSSTSTVGLSYPFPTLGLLLKKS